MCLKISLPFQLVQYGFARFKNVMFERSVAKCASSEARSDIVDVGY